MKFSIRQKNLLVPCITLYWVTPYWGLTVSDVGNFGKFSMGCLYGKGEFPVSQTHYQRYCFGQGGWSPHPICTAGHPWLISPPEQHAANWGKRLGSSTSSFLPSLLPAFPSWGTLCPVRQTHLLVSPNDTSIPFPSVLWGLKVLDLVMKNACVFFCPVSLKFPGVKMMMTKWTFPGVELTKMQINRSMSNIGETWIQTPSAYFRERPITVKALGFLQRFMNLGCAAELDVPNRALWNCTASGSSMKCAKFHCVGSFLVMHEYWKFW